MLLLPMYIMLVKLHLINTYLGIVIMYSATALPFCIWQMKGYYDTIPTSLEEAGRIDGCNQFQTFYPDHPAAGGPGAGDHRAVLVHGGVDGIRGGRADPAGHRICGRCRSGSSPLNRTWDRNGGSTARRP